MNYFAHGHSYIDDPYFLAGTAVPDWLNVVDRRVRVRAKKARPFVDDDDLRVAAIARGIVQHHHDDAWFHETRAFAELTLSLTAAFRDVLPADEGFRPSFLAHLLVELLLDAELIRRDEEALDRYYDAVEQIDADVVAAAVGRMAGRNADALSVWIPRFSAERFLSDYAEDAKLWTRLNQVMRRVRLTPLPRDVLSVLPDARALVAARCDELLTPAVI